MKKPFYRAATAAGLTGLMAGSLLVHAQSGGAAAGAGSAGAASAGAGAPAAASGANAAINANAPGVGQPGAGVGVNSRGGAINSIGAAGINQPASPSAIGGASVIGSAPNAVGGSSITAQNPGARPAGTVGTSVGTLPGDLGQPPAPSGTVQGSLGVGTAVVNPALANAQAGIPMTSLTPALQQTIQSRLGGAQVQTISRDDLANGSIFRVTTVQNGVPTEMRFGANGTFLGSTAVQGAAATSYVNPAAVAGTVPVVLDTLPVPVQTAIRTQTGTGRINSVTPQGQTYVVTYDSNGQLTTMVVGPDGRILRAAPTALGAPAPAATGAGSSTNRNGESSTNNGQRSSSVELNELPQEVRNVLRQEMGAANIQSIRKEQRPAGDFYVVGARSDDSYVQLTMDSEGRIVKDSRDVPIVAIGAAKKPENNLASGIPFHRVPVAVQNAVKAYASASDIRSVNLGLDQGKSVYDIVYMRGGRRDRMIVAKDGNLIRKEQDVSPTLDANAKGPKLAIGDLPVPARETILKHTGQVLVKEVATKRLGDQTVYSVQYETNGAPVELFVSADGAVIVPETSPDADRANSPSPAPLPVQEASPVRVVNNLGDPAPSVGAAAATESREGTSLEQPTSADPDAPRQKVTLTDVPLAVQTNATKLARNGVIESINPKLGDSGVIYEVTISEEGRRRTVRLNKDGALREAE